MLKDYRDGNVDNTDYGNVDFKNNYGDNLINL